MDFVWFWFSVFVFIFRLVLSYDCTLCQPGAQYIDQVPSSSQRSTPLCLLNVDMTSSAIRGVSATPGRNAI